MILHCLSLHNGELSLVPIITVGGHGLNNSCNYNMKTGHAAPIHLALSLALFSKDPLTKALYSTDSCDDVYRLKNVKKRIISTSKKSITLQNISNSYFNSYVCIVDFI